VAGRSAEFLVRESDGRFQCNGDITTTDYFRKGRRLSGGAISNHFILADPAAVRSILNPPSGDAKSTISARPSLLFGYSRRRHSANGR